MPVGIDLQKLAPGLARDAQGLWVSPSTVVSYPDAGHEFCLGVEESSFWFRHRNRAIAALISRNPPAAPPFFDVGAGNGFVAAMLQREGLPVVAVEPGVAGARNTLRRGVVHVVRGEFPLPGLREGSAGGIGLFDVLEHIEDDRAFLTGLRPYLAEGGRLYVTTPAHRLLWSDDDVVAGHHRRYSRAGLAAVLAAAGYLPDYVSYYFWWLPPAILLKRVLTSRLRKRRAAHVASVGEHTIGGGIVRELVGATFAPEDVLIRSGMAMPFGASLIATARV